MAFFMTLLPDRRRIGRIGSRVDELEGGCGIVGLRSSRVVHRR